MDEEHILPRTTPIWVDGLNLAYWCGRQASLRVPLSALAGMLAQGRPAQLVFDASAQYQLPPDEHGVYAALLERPEWATQVPSGHTADLYLLEAAKADNGVVVSRDRFREHRRRFRSIVHASRRRTDGFVSEDVLQIPTLSLHSAVLKTAAEAWEQLCAD